MTDKPARCPNPECGSDATYVEEIDGDNPNESEWIVACNGCHLEAWFSSEDAALDAWARMGEWRDNGWRPIETAPRDGTAIWLLVDGEPFIGHCEPWHPDDTWMIKAGVRRSAEKPRIADEVYGCHGICVLPTHWMPLPEPPKEEP